MAAEQGEDGARALACARCSKPATLQCPKCLELKLEKDFAAFCSQECFKVREEDWCPAEVQGAWLRR